MSKTIFTGLFFLVCLAQLLATGDSLRYLTPKDTIFLTIEFDSEYIFEHYIERKQTLFSLGQFYGLSLEELYFYNPGLKERTLGVGESVRVPIPKKAIIRYQNNGFDAKKHVPVAYVVKKGDTIFGIAKRYFRMEISEIMTRNNLSSESVKVGQRLLIGWMSMDGVPAEYHDTGGSPYARRNNAMRKVYLREKGDKKEKEHQGAASWQRESKEAADFYALHRYAAKNSIIQVYNPMNKETIYVKVIGKIPDSAYDNNVVVVLSPMAARALGALDPRFFVQVKYY